MKRNQRTGSAKLAFRFVLTIGIVNLFADLTYEGARSVTGPFLGSLGASATAIGIVVGFGELLGYSLRSVSGFLADKTHKYWVFAFVGYGINMLAVPALALAGSWPLAAVLIIAERTGRAIRRPSVESMISYAGQEIGHGWVFGLNEALDQGGATVGPLVVALVLYLKGSYRYGFAVLLLSALLCLGTLVVARILYPRPHELERTSPHLLESKGFPKAYWLYVIGGAFIAAGFADFALIAFHFQRSGSVSENLIPVFYAVAMGVGAIAALLFGRLLDRIGFPILIIAVFLSALFVPFVFLGSAGLALVGMMLWGIGMGAQDSLLKAVLTKLVSARKRSTAFGLFDTGFGIAWFLGSVTLGFLYDKSIASVIIVSLVLQLLALTLLVWGRRSSKDIASI
jgi:predicted MFS family arabinose efflux permease